MPALLSVDHRHPTPLYAQLEQGIRGAIVTGRLAAGAQLPTVRQLAIDLRVNANTIARVYSDLEREGVLETRRGIGTFIAARTPSPQEDSLRRTELNRLVDRFLADLSHHGFGVDDAMPEIERRRTQGA